MDKVKRVLLIILGVILIFAGVYRAFMGATKQYMVRNIVTDRTDFKETDVSAEEIELLNRCFDYHNKYLYGAAPTDKETLDTIKYDLETAFKDNLFFGGFSKSKFQKALEENDSYYKNVDDNMGFGTNYLKMEYFSNLNIVLQKVYLLLDDFDSYEKNRLDTYNLYEILVSGHYWAYFEEDIAVIDSQERTNVVYTTHKKLLELAENDIELFRCMQSQSFLADYKENSKEEYDKYIRDYTGLYDKIKDEKGFKSEYNKMIYGFRNPKLNPHNEFNGIYNEKYGFKYNTWLIDKYLDMVS